MEIFHYIVMIVGKSLQVQSWVRTMSKRHEYSETEWGFPEVWNSYECGDFYDAEYVQDWIKRCIKDYPKEYYQPEPDDWFDKWFSQFIEKGEENGNQ